jgi:hypothetical protein
VTQDLEEEEEEDEDVFEPSSLDIEVPFLLAEPRAKTRASFSCLTSTGFGACWQGGARIDIIRDVLEGAMKDMGVMGTRIVKDIVFMPGGFPYKRGS